MYSIYNYNKEEILYIIHMYFACIKYVQLIRRANSLSLTVTLGRDLDFIILGFDL